MSPAPIPEAAFRIEADEGALGLYRFGTGTAKHYFCSRCGIYTFHETARKSGHYRVNLGCVEGVDPLSLKTDIFDGRSLP